MKKTLSLLLAALLMLSLCACGAAPLQPAGQNEAPAGQEVTILPTTEDKAEESQPAEPGTPAEPAAEDSQAAPDEAAAAEDPAAEEASAEAESKAIDEDGFYYDVENVTLYLMTYGRLPSNYITKKQAENLGWSGGSVQRYQEGAAIGGSRFGNYEGILPDGNYTECDIDTNGASSRGAKRLVFSDDGRYYYTDDHYESFAQVTFENGKLVLNYDY